MARCFSAKVSEARWQSQAQGDVDESLCVDHITSEGWFVVQRVGSDRVNNTIAYYIVFQCNKTLYYFARSQINC